jgi:Flp pilus assembly protein TadB
VPPRKRTPDSPAPEQTTTRPGKGRPTPKRKEAEAARRRPLVPDSRGDAKARKAAERERRLQAQKAMLEGDERYLPTRDKGPVRRMTRDLVDARRNFGDYFVWYALGLLVAMFVIAALAPTIGTENAAMLLFGLNYLTIAVAVAAVVDGWLLARRLRKRLTERFGEDRIPRGTVMYGVLRAFQMRRMRVPRPQVQRGAQPR